MKKRFFTVLLLWITLTIGQSQEFLYSRDKPLPCVEKKFYVYLHVSLDTLGKGNITLERIRDLLDKANRVFAPICMSFDYCKLDTIRDYAFENIKDTIEVNLLTSRFQKKRRLNIYLVNSVMSNSFSIYNGITKEETGVIIIPKDGSGLIHELGYIFGLHHTFETRFGLELVDGSNCATAGDLICDTPADPIPTANETCTFDYPGKDENDDYYRTEIGNYMSGFYCAHCFFTREQYEVMANNYLQSTFKMW